MQDPRNALADRVRRFVDVSRGKHFQHAMFANRVEADRGQATTLRTVRVTAKLAWTNLACEISSEVHSGASEDAIRR
jgi:hypothetical protein